MMNSLKSTVDTLEPLITRGLIPQSHLARIKSIAQWVPALLTYRFAFETYLQPQRQRTDFAVLAASYERGRDILAGLVPEPALSDELLQNSTWKRIREFSRLWADPSSPIHNSGSVWLEFDSDSDNNKIPIPGFLFAVDNPLQKIDWLSSVAFSVLFNHELSRNQKSDLAKILKQFGSTAAFLGSMLSRAGEMVRVTMLNIDHQLSDAMMVGWNWSDDMKRLHSRLSEIVEGINVSFDLTHSHISPRMGIEYQFRKYLDVEPRWERLLTILTDAGLCTSEMKNQLLQWHGASICQFPHLIWKSRVVRHLNHVKLIWDPSEAVQAKIYYLFIYTQPA